MRSVAQGSPRGCRGRWLFPALVLVVIATDAYAQPAPAPSPVPLGPLPALKQEPDLRKASLGRLLFFDGRLSGDGSTSCATCHDPQKGWADGLPLAKGYPGSLYFRNTPTVLNSGRGRYLYWDGRLPASDLPTLVRDHLTEAHFMQTDGRLLIERLRQAPAYDALFREAFGGEPSFGRILDAVAAFLGTLGSRDVPFDRHLAGEASSMSDAAKRGLFLFTGKARCVQCHGGPMLADDGFHDLGLPAASDVLGAPERSITFRRFFRTLGVSEFAIMRRDVGRHAVTKQSTDRGRFRTPTLREVSRTAPYMHDGSLATLEAVVDFYDRGGGSGAGKDPLLEPLGLTQAEKKDLVALLEALSGAPVRGEVPELPDYELGRLGGETAQIPKPGPTHAPDVSTASARRPADAAARTFPPLAALPKVPVPRDNPVTPAKVRLGRLLFFDNRLSGDGSTSCASCHDARLGWGDGNALSRGYPGTQHWRNSQTVVNSAYLAKLFWAGESTSLESQAASAITGILAGNGDPVMVEERLAQVPEYVRLFAAAFGVSPPRFGLALKAIAAFERAEVISSDSPFDRFMRGDKSALSPEALRGMVLFTGKAACVRCHNGSLLTDEGYHNLGVPKNPLFERDPQRQIAHRYQHYSRGVSEEVYRESDRDLGLYYTSKRPWDRGKFRTPPLRYLAYTAPYMHNGVFATLEEVVDFYDKGGGEDPAKSSLLATLQLTDTEKEDLVAFLESLSGGEVKMGPPVLPEYESTQP